MEKEPEQTAAGNGKPVYVSQKTLNAIEDLSRKLRIEGIHECSIVFSLGGNILPVLEATDLHIIPGAEFCDFYPDEPEVPAGGIFRIANDTACEVTVTVPSGIFEGIDDPSGGAVDFTIPPGANLQFKVKEEGTFAETVIEEYNIYGGFFVGLSCTNPNGTGGSPKGVIQPTP